MERETNQVETRSSKIRRLFESVGQIIGGVSYYIQPAEVPILEYGHPWPGTISLSPSADGPITTLARIELNARNGRPLDEGLTHPDALNQAGSP